MLARVAAVAVTIALTVAAFYSLKRGIADNFAYDASVEMGTWIAARSQPGEQTWSWVRSDLERAVNLTGDPISHELLGVLLAMRSGRPDLTALARQNFQIALSMRPSSGYTWANLAEVLYQQGITDSPFEAALRRATQFGPNEPEVQRTVANLGLAVFDQVSVTTRQSIEDMVAAGFRRNPAEMLHISGRRGRLDVACRHANGTQSGAHQHWLQLCQSREATS